MLWELFQECSVYKKNDDDKPSNFAIANGFAIGDVLSELLKWWYEHKKNDAEQDSEVLVCVTICPS